jgi:hypothetical protein
MGFGDMMGQIDKDVRDSKGNRKPRRVKRVIEMDEAVFLAMTETLERIHASRDTTELSLDVFIQMAVQRELLRREVTWWEGRVSKAMRTLTT